MCKHWLRGLCKKDDQCEFLHIFDLQKMPPCHFFAEYGICERPDCMFLHIDPETTIRNCAWYARGFCKHGNNCKNRHIRKEACPLYLAGFCIKGPDCEMGHPKYELPVMGDDKEKATTDAGQVCSTCGKEGHLAVQCQQEALHERNREMGRTRDVSQVVS